MHSFRKNANASRSNVLPTVNRRSVFFRSRKNASPNSKNGRLRARRGADMSARKSVHIDGLSHLTGIPVATRIGPLLMSSVIAPFNPGTRQVPEGYAAQYANVFRH